jgi:phospholipid N-methyltransferase
MGEGDILGRLAFVKHFIKDPMLVGSVWPSSNALARAMTRGIDFDRDFIVELGCGTGSVTHEIAKNIGHSQNYLGFEIQPELQSRLRTRFPSLQFVADSATELHRHLVPSGRPINVVLSSLPFTTIDQTITRSIISEYSAALAPGGMFRFFLYAQTISLPRNQEFLRLLSGLMIESSRQRVMWNLPPAYVITFRKPEGPKGQSSEFP